jgi:pimeloyl-ACP methyl ester carboxylesterase
VSVLTKSIKLAILLCALSITATAQESIEGYWEGAIVRDGAVRIVRVSFFKEGAAMKARFEMPDFISYGLRTMDVKQESGKVTLRIPMHGEVTLALDAAAGEMRGAAGGSLPPVSIHLKRAVRMAEIPVKREEVQFQNSDVTLSGTLIAPAVAGRHPVIVWIHGRGGTIREDSARAKLFAQHGVASLIYDKRGSGKSTGDLSKATINDLASDVIPAIAFLATRGDINPSQIGIHGESAGGWIAPIVATRSKPPVAFVMTSVGPAESLEDQQVHAYEYMLRLSDTKYGEDEIALAKEYARLRMRFIFRNEGQQEYEAAVGRVKGTRLAGLLIFPQAQDARDIDWLRRNNYDPAPDLKKITAPFLAFYGAKDYVVPPRENAKRLEGLLAEARNKDFKVVTIEGTDHDLSYEDGIRRTPGRGLEDYQWGWGRVAPLYVETMLDWLLKRVTVVKSNSAH